MLLVDSSEGEVVLATSRQLCMCHPPETGLARQEFLADASSEVASSPVAQASASHMSQVVVDAPARYQVLLHLLDRSRDLKD